MPGHIALVGDSVFDNASYVGDQPDVIAHLRSLIPPDWTAELRAVDGSTTIDLAPQLKGVSPAATHIVLSVGGNDALMSSDLLNTPVGSTTEALLLIGDRVREFETNYRAAVANVLGLERATTLCTIYDGNLSPVEAKVARVALTPFNDVILRVGFELTLSIIDLRLVCTEPEDYANAIEPSGQGGRKIASAIVTSLGLARRPGVSSTVYIG